MKKFISVILCVTLCFIPCLAVTGFAAETSDDYAIVSPYSDVIWEGDDAWGSCRSVLRTIPAHPEL